MYRVIQGSTGGWADVEAFIECLNRLRRLPAAAAGKPFESGPEIFVARAPGRLDVMGGIADYSGSLVLQWPIAEATFAALQRDEQRRLRIMTMSCEAGRNAVFEMPLSAFEDDGEPIRYDAARALFGRDASTRWAAYVAGVFLVLMRERGVRFEQGARILIDSHVPEGKGVSSSAAIEVATMRAVAAAFEIEVSPRDTALLCQKVENLVVGAPCGVMDQMTSACGAAGELLALLCQPAELQPSVPVPEGVAFWGLDSGLRHSVSGSDYGSVRVGAFMGYRIIADLAGLPARPGGPGEPVVVDDGRWGGYLANVTPSVFRQCFEDELPEQLTGEAFLERYDGTTDAVTRVDPARTYAIRRPAGHPVYEHHRVQAFAELLQSPLSEARLRLLGEWMYQSHASYSACGLGSSGTDRLVELVREAGPGRGLYGAKITGGGSGGTVAVLGRCDAGDVVEEIARRYADETGHMPYLFRGTSPGACDFGHLVLSDAGG